MNSFNTMLDAVTAGFIPAIACTIAQQGPCLVAIRDISGHKKRGYPSQAFGYSYAIGCWTPDSEQPGEDVWQQLAASQGVSLTAERNSIRGVGAVAEFFTASDYWAALVKARNVFEQLGGSANQWVHVGQVWAGLESGDEHLLTRLGDKPELLNARTGSLRSVSLTELARYFAFQRVTEFCTPFTSQAKIRAAWSAGELRQYFMQDALPPLGRGGRRVGAGRPADAEGGSKVLIGQFRVAPDVAELVNAQPAGLRSDYIERAIKHFNHFLSSIPDA